MTWGGFMYTWIDDYVMGLSETYNTYDIYELYNLLQIKIEKLDKDNILLQGNESIYYRDYFGLEIVFVRDDLNYEYEKFILAHELGHAIIHTDIYIAAFNKDLINIGKYEKQAHYFALKLLKIDLSTEEFDGLTIEQIAGILQLPKDCLESAGNF